MAYANTYQIDDVKNSIVFLRRDTTDKKVQYRQTYQPKRFMRIPGFQNVTADGAVTIKDGVVISTKAGVCAMTLAAPAPEDDGKVLVFRSATAQAHTVTAAGGFNAGGTASDVATFGGAIGDGFICVAWQGAWYVSSTTNVTLA